MREGTARPAASSDQIWLTLMGRLMAALYLLGGVVAFLSPLLPPAPVQPVAVMAVGAAAVAVGVVALVLPWGRWPRRAPLAGVVLAFPLVGLYNLFVGGEPFRYAIFFLWVFAYLGVAQPRWTGLAFVPLFAPAYVLPLLVVGAPVDTALASGLLVGIAGMVLGETIAWIMTGMRIAQAELARRLRFEGLHDPLTGLPNRALFRDRVEHAIARGGGDAAEVAVLLLDLDDFKTVNDALGHEAGDTLLVGVAHRIRGGLGAADTVARMGGDEFGILLETAGQPATAAAGRIAQCLAAPFHVGLREVAVRASIGIARATAATTSVDELLRDADVAMYRAKAEARGGYRVFEPAMHELTQERLGLRADLVGALERHEFAVHYQPVVELASGRIAGFEALVRWQRPAGRLMAPGQFLPEIEQLGLQPELDAWVLRTACAQLAHWARAIGGCADLTIGVNLTARELMEPDFAERAHEAVAATHVEPQRVTLEIIEGGLVDDRASTRAGLAALRRAGFSLAIDDFGVGYSSLAYLRQFPFDVLKIDASFIAALGTSDTPGKLAEAIVTLGSSLGLQVVAEGIEHPRQLDRLRALRCPLGQGYLLSPPLPAADATDLLRSGRRIAVVHRASTRRAVGWAGG